MNISSYKLLRCLALAIGACICMGTGMANAGAVLDRIQANATLRVCEWPDYYGVSHRNPNSGQLQGIDIDLSQELARDLRVRVQYVDSSFPTLVEDLNTGRCDIAMFAVGMLPQRMAVLTFSRPYLRSDIYAVTTKSNRAVRQWADIDQPGVLVGVQAGTFMEPVMKDALKRAQMVVIKPPATREAELEAGRIDVFMTDYPYSRRLLDNADWDALISPPKTFFQLPYGYAVKMGDDAWASQVDQFVARIQRDGRLRTAATKHKLLPILVNE